MASYSQRIILITLILTITIPISIAYRRGEWRRGGWRRGGNAEQFLRDLCSKNDRADACLSIIKANPHLFKNSNKLDAVSDVIDLALEKTYAFGDQFNQWYKDTNDNKIRKKYGSCSKNYDEVSAYLEDAQRDFDSYDYQRTADRVNDAQKELKNCGRVFGSGSFDPGHVENRNNEIQIYLDIIRAATTRLD